MATILNASTSSGLVAQADTSGVLQLQTANTAALTIDTSANVGIGTSSPTGSWAGTKLAINTGDINFQSTSSPQNIIWGATASYSYISGNASSNVLAFGTSNTERMRIDSSGNVGIGTSSPISKLDVRAPAGELGRFALNNSGVGYLLIGGATSTTEGLRLSYNNADGSSTINNFYNAHLAFATNNTERMRIDSSGNVGIGATTLTAKLHVVGDGSVVVPMRNNNTEAGTGSSNSMAFQRNGTTVGLISVTGSATTYATSSDYRLKENIAPMTGVLAKVAQLNPVTYKWKADGSSGQGFIAHELQAVVSECVTGEKDAVDEEGNPKYQGIDTSFLVATLTAAIQELNAKVDAQVAEIKALKGVA